MAMTERTGQRASVFQRYNIVSDGESARGGAVTAARGFSGYARISCIAGSCRWESFKAKQTRIVDAPDAEHISRGLFE